MNLSSFRHGMMMVTNGRSVITRMFRALKAVSRGNSDKASRRARTGSALVDPAPYQRDNSRYAGEIKAR